jgi:muramoyltetrapeptide carboxypeptidase
MIVPPNLKTGDNIAIIAPAGKIDAHIILAAEKLLNTKGFNVKKGNFFSKANSYFSGTDDEPLQDLQWALNDKDVKAIFCARGGYGTIKLLESLNFDEFKKNPKWLIGFSDITVLHNILNIEGFCSIHGTMPVKFKNDKVDKSLDSVLKIITGESIEYLITPHQYNNMGNATAEIVGGNLSIIYSLRGTKYDIDTKGKILFIEDIDEYNYHLDRMMYNLYLGDKLRDLKGMIIGNFTAFKDGQTPFDYKGLEVIYQYTKALNIPVVFGFPAGHEELNLALPLGKKIKLEVTKNKVTITV